MSIGYGPKWPFYLCYGLYWIDGIYVVSINAGAQEVIFTLYSCIRDSAWSLMLIGTGYIQVMYLGRAPSTKETLLDFRERCRVTRHSRVFRWLTGSQRTPGNRGVTAWFQSLGIRIPSELRLGIHHHLGGLM